MHVGNWFCLVACGLGSHDSIIDLSCMVVCDYVYQGL
jgi:hypothetical protein